MHGKQYAVTVWYGHAVLFFHLDSNQQSVGKIRKLTLIKNTVNI